MIRFWIDGQPPRKSNSRKIVRNARTGKPMVIKSAKARAWVEGALIQIPQEARLNLGSLDHPVGILFHVYYKTRRPDLSVELILDTIEKAGVIANDRYVYEYHAFKEFSKDRPGVQVTVYGLEDP